MDCPLGYWSLPKTLPIKFASRVFAFDAILVPFTARLSFWLCVCVCVCNRYSTENCQKDAALFFVFWKRVGRSQKMGKLQSKLFMFSAAKDGIIMHMDNAVGAVLLSRGKEFA